MESLHSTFFSSKIHRIPFFDIHYSMFDIRCSLFLGSGFRLDRPFLLAGGGAEPRTPNLWTL